MKLSRSRTGSLHSSNHFARQNATQQLADKIINDIRQLKANRPNTPIIPRRFPILFIVTNHLILSPIGYVQHWCLEIFTLIWRGIRHPLQFPSVVGELVRLVVEEGRMGISQVYYTMFGVGSNDRRRKRVMGATASGYDSLPELENEEKTSTEGKNQSPSSIAVDKIAKAKPIRYEPSDLPPAFLLDSEYPSGWLVYNCKYGVVCREKMLRLDGHG
jgi:hypothetical protein